MLNFNKKKYVSFDNLKSFNGLLQSSLKEKLDGYKSEVDTKVQKKFNELSGKVQTDSEVIDARKGEASLKAKIDVIDEDIKSVSSQLEHIEKQTKLFVNIKDFEKYKVGDDWSEGINKAIDYINTTDCFELYFPPGTYKVTKPLNSINKIGCICGNSKLDTIIEYTPTTNSTLLSINVNTTLTMYFSIKDITFKCTSKTYKVNGVVCSKGEISQNLWGAGISIERTRVLGFTGVGIKIYAPFMSKLDAVYVGGPGYTANGDIPTGIKAVGIELTGCEGGLNTFGNVNSIRNSMIAGCCYGLKIVSVGNVSIENTTFEPNFINVYAYNLTPKGFCDNIVFNNCWFENYNKDGHSKYGAFCIYEFDEYTGDIKNGQTSTNRAGIYNNMSLVHSSCSNNSLRVTHKPGGGVLHGSLIGSVENEDKDITILNYSSEFGSPIHIGTKYNRIHAHTSFNRGIAHSYSNRNESWIASREQHLYKWKNLTEPASQTIETIDFVIPDIFDTPEILEVRANIAIKVAGGNIMHTKSECMIYNLKNIVEGTNKTTVVYNPWNDLKEIETGFIGSMLSFDRSTKTITVSVKSSATYSINVNLELKASYITSQIK